MSAERAFATVQRAALRRERENETHQHIYVIFQVLLLTMIQKTSYFLETNFQVFLFKQSVLRGFYTQLWCSTLNHYTGCSPNHKKYNKEGLKITPKRRKEHGTVHISLESRYNYLSPCDIKQYPIVVNILRPMMRTCPRESHTSLVQHTHR